MEFFCIRFGRGQRCWFGCSRQECCQLVNNLKKENIKYLIMSYLTHNSQKPIIQFSKIDHWFLSSTIQISRWPNLGAWSCSRGSDSQNLKDGFNNKTQKIKIINQTLFYHGSLSLLVWSEPQTLERGSAWGNEIERDSFSFCTRHFDLRWPSMNCQRKSQWHNNSPRF